MSRFGHLEFSDDLDIAAIRREMSGAPGAGELSDGDLFRKKADKLFAQGRFEKALLLYSKALRDDPDLEAPYLGQVRCLLEMDEIPEARTWVFRALERHPDSADLLSAKALVSAREGLLGAGMGFSDAAMKKKGATAFSWLARAEILWLGKSPNARACLEQALILPSADLLAQAGAVCLRSRQLGLAADYLGKAAEKDPNNPFVCFLQGRTQEAAKNYRSASAFYRKTVDRDPQFPQAAEALKRASRGRGFFKRLLSG